jgi:hypothetical protein
MLYQSKKEVLLFKYCSMDAIQCSFDTWYPDVESVYEDFLPIRVKGRNTGNPEWGQLEILKDGQWVDYSM